MRRDLRRALGDETRALIGIVVAEHERTSADQRPAGKGPRDALAGQLWMNVSSRIQSAQSQMDLLIESRLGAGPGGIAQDSPETRGFVANLSDRVRQHDAARYQQYCHELQRVAPVPWRLESQNPMGAQTLCAALIYSIEDVLLDNRSRQLIEAILVDAAPARLSKILASLIRDDGSLAPAAASPIGYDRGRQPAKPSKASASAQTINQPERQSSKSMATQNASNPQNDGTDTRALTYDDSAARAEKSVGRLRASALEPVREGAALRGVPILKAIAAMEADAVAFAHSIGEVPYSRASRQRYFSNARQRLVKEHASSTHLALVDLVSAMFDYVIDDRRSPEAAKPLIWRMQQPALLLTLLDPAYLGEHPRSLRRLLESFGAISNAFGEDFTRGSELHRRLETVVRAIEIISNNLHIRSAVLSSQVEKAYQRTAANMRQLVDRVVRERLTLEATPGRRNRRDYGRRPGRDQERKVTDRLTRLINDKIDDLTVPDSVQSFLHDVWLRHLRTALLRDGEQSREFARSVEILGELLWTLSTESTGLNRRELAKRIPPLVEAVTRGMREIGVSHDAHQGFFDELFLIHLKKLQRPQAEEKSAERIAARAAPNAPLERAILYDVGQAVPVLNQTVDIDSDGQDSDAHTENSGGLQDQSSIEPDAGNVGGGAAMPSQASHGETQTIGDTQATETSQLSDIATGEPVSASNDEGKSSNNRMLSVLHAIDLTDLPRNPRLSADDSLTQFGRLRRGVWLSYRPSSGANVFLKLAWLNERRTVALLVRHPDGRAVSRSMPELQAAFKEGRLHLLAGESGLAVG